MACQDREKCEKDWGKDICLAKKDILNKSVVTRVKVGFMWGIMIFCAVSALGSVGTLVAVVSAQSSKEATQQADIKKNAEKIEYVVRDHEHLESNVTKIQEDLGKMKVEQAVQGEILKGIAEKLRVPIPNGGN